MRFEYICGFEMFLVRACGTVAARRTSNHVVPVSSPVVTMLVFTALPKRDEAPRGNEHSRRARLSIHPEYATSLGVLCTSCRAKLNAGKGQKTFWSGKIQFTKTCSRALPDWQMCSEFNLIVPSGLFATDLFTLWIRVAFLRGLPRTKMRSRRPGIAKIISFPSLELEK